MGVSVSRSDATPCALLQKEASQRQQRRSVAPASQRRSVAAPTASQRRSPRRSVAAPTASQRRSHVAASQRQQRRSVTPASQRRSANSVAASLAQRQRRSVAASQRRSATRPPERRSVAASQRHPPPGASQRNVGNPRFGPLCPCTEISAGELRFQQYNDLRSIRLYCLIVALHLLAPQGKNTCFPILFRTYQDWQSSWKRHFRQCWHRAPGFLEEWQGHIHTNARRCFYNEENPNLLRTHSRRRMHGF